MRFERVGFLADTHSNKADGSDLPDAALRAFEGCDLIVHLGDVGRKGILPRLEAVAPVWVPFGDDKGYVPPGSDAEPVKVIDVGGLAVGLTFNIAKPDKKIDAGEGQGLTFAAPVADLVKRRFKRDDVAVVAFGGTHVAHTAEHDGVTFLNPGSPNLPSDKQGEDDLGSVAVLSVTKGKPKVALVRLTA